MRILFHISVAFIVAGFSSVFAEQQFTDVSSTVGLVHVRQKSWGNPIWGDINNDGYLDLIVPCHGLAASGGPFVYLNNAGQSFSDIRATCGIHKGPTLDDGDWHGYAFGDFDQDGNLDVYIAEGAKGQKGGTTKRDLLFQGHGDGTFSYVSDTAGLETSMNRGRSPFWVDYNNDGFLDLFMKNHLGYNVLYQGQSNGTLAPSANGGGLADATSKGIGSIVSFADYDNDGLMDVVITGDSNAQELDHNQGDGTFVNVTAASGIGTKAHGKGIAWGDYNNDGFIDLFIARGQLGRPDKGTSLYRNNGDGTFTDVTVSAGLDVDATCWAGVWGDYDNDGSLDLFVTTSGSTGNGANNGNFLFHNNGDGTFTNVATAAGVAMEDGVSLHKGASWADYNNDGFLDLMVKDGVGNETDDGDAAKGFHFLFKNNGNSNHFIKVNLQGVESNLRGIGARVRVSSTNGIAYRQNNGGGGGENASQGSEPLHFGIGQASSATVEVTWPSGIVDKLNEVSSDSTLTIVEGSHSTSSPPVITQQVRNRNVEEGEPAHFAVTASGGQPLNYQWRKNGQEIADAQAPNYTTPPVTQEDNGAVFSVVITNSAGSVTSRNAKLTVPSSP